LILRTILFALLFCSAVASAQNLEVVSAKKTLTLTLDTLKAKLKSYTVKIDDPVYLKTMEFDAFLLSDVLQAAGVDSADRADELIFTAVDGYAPSVSFDKLKDHKAYLAYQDHATPGRFPLVQQGKAMISPWPFYVVWSDGAKLKDEVPWPYQLVKLEVANWSAKFPKLVPVKLAANSAQMQGFALFKDHCVRCHSINLQGGDIGPELNVPQNVTEYWSRGTLKDFIKDASKFRAKSKMPSFTQFSDKDIDHIYAYLRIMREHKIP
jgi:mono/diheme cytochrome c family protein